MQTQIVFCKVLVFCGSPGGKYSISYESNDVPLHQTARQSGHLGVLLTGVPLDPTVREQCFH